MTIDSGLQFPVAGRSEHRGRRWSRAAVPASHEDRAVATDGELQLCRRPDAALAAHRRAERAAPPGCDPYSGAGRYGVPVTFGGTVGIFYPGSAPVGVLMLSPFGYEEMCCRTTWRALAEATAAAGLPCLRFDHPGTGDALDHAAPVGIEDWASAAAEAAGLLRAFAGVDRVILLGQGLGAALAARIAHDVGTVEALAYLAPVVNGRRHLRELGLWARVITDRIGIGCDPDDVSGCAVAGFALTPDRARAIRGVDLLRPDAVPVLPSLVVARPERPADAALAAHLRSLGAEVAKLPYVGYDKLAADPSVAIPPTETIAAVAAWLSNRAALPGPTATGRPEAASARPLLGPGFTEQPLRFGPEERLFGVLCRPAAAPTGRAVVFVESGRDHHVGLGRATVAQARALAARGIASLRFDPSGIGDSPPAAGDEREILYSEEQIADVSAAIGVLGAAGFGAVTLIGRCSGAHAAFHAALRDDRVDRLAMVNLSRFVWDPREDVAESLRYGHRRLGDFGTALWREGGWRRLLSGRLRVGAAGRHLARRGATAVALRLAPVLGGFTRGGRAWREVRRGMAALAARRIPVTLIYSADDPGLDELRRHFGPGGRDLAALPGATVEIIPDVDHNFTHRAARDRLTAALMRSVAA